MTVSGNFISFQIEVPWIGWEVGDDDHLHVIMNVCDRCAEESSLKPVWRVTELSSNIKPRFWVVLHKSLFAILGIMSMSDCSCEDMIRQGIMRRIKKIIPKEQLSDFNYDALIFNRLDRIRDEIAGIRDSGKIPFGPIELEILQFFLAHHMNRLDRTAFKAINDLFTDLGYRGYRKHPLRARQRKESLRKRGVSPEELVKNFRVFHVPSHLYRWFFLS